MSALIEDAREAVRLLCPLMDAAWLLAMQRVDLGPRNRQAPQQSDAYIVGECCFTLIGNTSTNQYVRVSYKNRLS